MRTFSNKEIHKKLIIWYNEQSHLRMTKGGLFKFPFSEGFHNRSQL
jgi:hypothetical protein